MIRQLVYISSTLEPLDDVALANILKHARERNAKYGVTGVLIYSDQSVMQVLEGLDTAVELIFNIVSSNPLHSGVTIVQDRIIARRDFGEWAMAFQPMDKQVFARLSGVRGFGPDVLARITDELSQPEAKVFAEQFNTRGSYR